MVTVKNASELTLWGAEPVSDRNRLLSQLRGKLKGLKLVPGALVLTN